MNDRLTQLLKFLEESPGDSFTLYSIAHEYQIQGDLAQALKYFSQLQEADPDYVGCYYHLGKVYHELDNPEKAKDIYEKGIVIASKQGDAHAASELSRALDTLMIEEDL